MASEKNTPEKEMREPVAFTVKFLKALRPAAKPQQIMDATHPGLGVRVAPIGKRGKSTPTITFVYRYKSPVTGKRDFITIGRFIEIRDEGDSRTDGPATLAEARAERNRLEALVLRGIDHNRPADPIDTIEAIGKDFLNTKVLDLQTRKTYASALNSKILPALGQRRIVEIERDEIIRLLDHVCTSSGYEMMRQTKKVLSSMFSFAMDRKGTRGLKYDVTKGIRLKQWNQEGKKKQRVKVWLKSTEIKLFWDYLDQHADLLNDSYARMWKLMLITGCRPIEAVGMKWSDIGHHILEDIRDLDKIDRSRLWLRPAELMKGDVPHLTYLTDLAMEVIEPLRGLPGDLVLWDTDALGENQMISRRKYGGELLKMSHGIFSKHENKDNRQIPQQVGVRKFTPHDLRRTVSTQMGNLGIKESDVSKVLAHAVREGEATVTRKHYNFAEYIHEKIDALTRWEQKLQEILSQQDNAPLGT